MALIQFETETCSRCGGSGHFSYNQIDGSRCYGCGGTGKRLSKRGAAAQAWLLDKVTMSIFDVQVGQTIRFPIYAMSGASKMVRRTVTAIEELKPTSGKSLQRDGSWKEYEVKGREFTFDKGEPHGFYGNFTVQRLATSDEVEAALAYQACLTKAGTVRKQKSNA